MTMLLGPAAGCSPRPRAMLAEEDERIVAGAIVGSLAVDGGDRFSDLDLTFGVADHVQVTDVLDDWTHTLIDELDAVQLADLERGPTTYRVFLVPDLLQLDLSMTPALQFRPAGHGSDCCSARLLRASPRLHAAEAGDLFISTPAVAEDIFGWVSSTCSTRAPASSESVFGKLSTTSAPCVTTLSRLPASARGGPRCRRATTTTFPLRPLLDSRMPTSAGSNLGRFGSSQPPPFWRSCARAQRRAYRRLVSLPSVSPSFADEPPTGLHSRRSPLSVRSRRLTRAQGAPGARVAR